MSIVLAWDQAGVASLAIGVANLPANSTLLKAKLSCYTWFSSDIGTDQVQGAPPNTLLAISWAAHGTTIPIVTTTNWKASPFIIAGPGRLLAYDRWTVVGTPADTAHTFVQHVYSNEIELDFPFFESAAFDLGISINFLGSGFWSNADPWLSYQFEAYFE